MALFASSTTLPHSPSAAAAALKRRGKDDGVAVYVTAVPLTAARGPAQMLMSAAYTLSLWDMQHFMVIVKPQPSHSQVLVYDFQPQDPENFYAVFAVLSQRQMSGVVRKRTLRRVPSRRCWLAGFSDANGTDVADKFSADWPTNLIVGKNDCRHFTNGLVECLTGEKCILDRLRVMTTT